MSTEIIANDSKLRVDVSPDTEEALQRLRPQLDALEPTRLSRPNMDVDVAARRGEAMRKNFGPPSDVASKGAPFSLPRSKQYEDARGIAPEKRNVRCPQLQAPHARRTRECLAAR